MGMGIPGNGPKWERAEVGTGLPGEMARGTNPFRGLCRRPALAPAPTQPTLGGQLMSYMTGQTAQLTPQALQAITAGLTPQQQAHFLQQIRPPQPRAPLPGAAAQVRRTASLPSVVRAGGSALLPTL